MKVATPIPLQMPAASSELGCNATSARSCRSSRITRFTANARAIAVAGVGARNWGYRWWIGTQATFPKLGDSERRCAGVPWVRRRCFLRISGTRMPVMKNMGLGNNLLLRRAVQLSPSAHQVFPSAWPRLQSSTVPQQRKSACPSSLPQPIQDQCERAASVEVKRTPATP